jgi:AmmeMemoRadiSam system protein B
MDEYPRLRPVEAFPVQEGGKALVCLRDPQRLAQSLVISPTAYFILCHLDGHHSAVDIQEAYCRKFSDILSSEDLKKFINLLDQHYYLYTERFFEHQAIIIEEFGRLAVRPVAHAGAGYGNDSQKLTAQIEEYFQSPKGPGEPDVKRDQRIPKAIVAPHIDFHRGGSGYAWSYKALAESPGADLYVLLGTSHCGGANPFTATLKDFATPFGEVETDKDFIQELRGSYIGDLFAEEHLHRTEHSLEFQVVFLKYVAYWRAKATGKEKPFKIVPILVSSFHPWIQSHTLPEQDPVINSFLKKLRDLVERESREVCFVAGVDLAHVGAQFGDQETMTPDFLKWVEEEDHRLIEKLAVLDAPGFFHEIAKDGDRRRICGFSPLYSLMHLLNGSQGKYLKYDQAFTPETSSAVTFTSLVFE